MFVGLIGMIDPARPEVKDAVALCRVAGIKPVMITGDYKNTAVAIAEELGILQDRSRVLTGRGTEPDARRSVSGKVEKVEVYARVSPAHKVQDRRGAEVPGARRGDDRRRRERCPALKRANIGVAMGITGTDVSKETAAMVLTDDNFASIVSAVEEGRVIYSQHPQVRLLPALLQRRRDPDGVHSRCSAGCRFLCSRFSCCGSTC